MRRFDIKEDDCENKICASTHFLQIQEDHLIDLQELINFYCNVILALVHYLVSFLLSILSDERVIEPTLIREANQIVFNKLGDIHVLSTVNFLGVKTSLDFILKAYKTLDTKGFFPYE